MGQEEYTRGGTNARQIGEEFLIGDLAIGAATFAASASTTDVITHGLSATPTFMFAQTFAADTSTLLMVANSTTVTVTRVVTSATLGYSYIFGVLS